MRFDEIIKSLLKEEEASKDDKLAALKLLAKKGNQYVVLDIVGKYYEAPQTLIDAFGRKIVSRNRTALSPKIKDYYISHRLPEYYESVNINYHLSSEHYSDSKDPLKIWLTGIESNVGDELSVILNPSKDITITAIEPKDLKYRSSRLFVAFPRKNTSVLSTVLESLGLPLEKFEEFLDDRYEDYVDEHDASWVNSRNHLAKYFLNLPGNQKALTSAQG